MIRGLEFNFSNSSNDFLKQLLGINFLSNTKVQIFQDEIILNEKNIRLKREVPSIEMSEFLYSNDPLIIFLNLRILPFGGVSSNITTYPDFFNSDYILIMLITDVKTVEIYTKDDGLLYAIYQLAMQTMNVKIFNIRPKQIVGAI